MPRKKTPHNLKVLAGTDRPDRAPPPDMPEFDLVENFPAAPQHLTPDGVEMWHDLGPQLVNARVLQVVDLYVLEQLCVSWQNFRRKAKAQVELTASESNALRGLFSELGMTPASRTKVKSGGEKPKGNKFAGNGRKTGA